MELFLDTADINLISKLLPTGMIDGITTNPSIIRKQFTTAGVSPEDYYEALGQYYRKLLNSYSALCNYSDEMREMRIPFPLVNLEIYSNSKDDDEDFIIKQVLKICGIVNTIYDNTNSNYAVLDIPRNRRLAVKIPLTQPALSACRRLKCLQNPFIDMFSNITININVTLCFTVPQVLMSARSGADYISVFLGRLYDNDIDGKAEMARMMLAKQPYSASKLLVASVRNIGHVVDAIDVSAESITMPCNIFSELYESELTDAGLKKFYSDWVGS